jgi:hypothetical protein
MQMPLSIAMARRGIVMSFAKKRGKTPAPLGLKSWFAHPVGGQSPFLSKAGHDVASDRNVDASARHGLFSV